MLLSLVLVIQLAATFRYHLVDATSQDCFLYFMLHYTAFSCDCYTTSSDVKISLSNLESMILLTLHFSSRNQYSSFHAVELRDSEPETLSFTYEMEHVHKGKKAQSALTCLQNDSWDAWQNSQNQRDRYRGRDLVFLNSTFKVSW